MRSRFGSTALNALLSVGVALAVLSACSTASPSESPGSGESSASTPESQMLEAIDAGDADAIEALLASGVSPDLELGAGGTVFTPLHRAAARDQAVIIEILIDAGADLEIRANGVTPLMIAADRGGPESVLALLQGGADPLIGNMLNWDMTALHYTAMSCNQATLATLLGWGVDIDLPDITKSTVLHWSVFFECTESVRYLIDQGADLNLLDENDSTPLRWARDLGFEEIAEMIEAAGGHE